MQVRLIQTRETRSALVRGCRAEQVVPGIGCVRNQRVAAGVDGDALAVAVVQKGVGQGRTAIVQKRPQVQLGRGDANLITALGEAVGGGTEAEDVVSQTGESAGDIRTD